MFGLGSDQLSLSLDIATETWCLLNSFHEGAAAIIRLRDHLGERARCPAARLNLRPCLLPREIPGDDVVFLRATTRAIL